MTLAKKESFDNIAWCYELLSYAVFGNSIRRSQVIYFDSIPKSSHVLVIGGGTGWILDELFKAADPGKVTYIESSSRMLELSRNKVGGQYRSRIDFILGTEESIIITGGYDVVITNYFLDLFEEARLKRVMDSIYLSLNNNGLWIFTDFRKKKNGSIFNKLLLKMMYLFFRLVCHIEAKSLPSIGLAFRRLNMLELKSDFFYFKNIKAVLMKKQFPD
jgi:ubiquinone/menaquinone biosynthesis C-methylase UbiE